MSNFNSDKSELEGFWSKKRSFSDLGPKPVTPESEDSSGSGPVRPPVAGTGSITVPVAPTAAPYSAPTQAPARQDYASSIHTEAVVGQNLTLDELLDKLLSVGGSDLHLNAGATPMMRSRGDLVPIEGYLPLGSNEIQRIMFAIMSPEQQKEFEQHKELDMAYALAGKSRFRVNVLRQRGNVGSVIRVIPHDIKSLEQLGMPAVLNEFAGLPRGLVLVTGPTGSGKSTTLAAIVDKANRQRRDHIITIEDPIEFVHENKNCIINQREVGADTESFAQALKHALRQDPDIILLGEMRDPETISTAITAAETGHLVFGTLHTQSAAETMSRIIDSFPDGSKNQVRAQLAATIQAVVCQTLVKTLDGQGRVAAVEILRGEAGVRALIRSGKEEQIRSALDTGKKFGMQSMDGHLKELVLADKIAIDEGANRATNTDQFYKSLGTEAEVERIRRRQSNQGGLSIGY